MATVVHNIANRFSGTYNSPVMRRNPRQEMLPFHVPDLDNREFDEIKDSLESGWVTTGPKTKRFEKEFAKAVGCKHAVALNSCTAAMHLALEAIGLSSGDEVITSPYTFAATAEVVRYFDAHPIFVDVEADTMNINASLIEGAITKRTKAIIPVHIAGLPSNMDAILDIAKRHNLKVIDDAAHAFPAKYHSHTIGGLSDVTCFSFYATKTLTTAEGGMLCTNDDDIADRCRMTSLHGIDKDAWKRYSAEGHWYYEIQVPGYKYNMTDIAAGMGLVQLSKSDMMWQRRREIAMSYSAMFSSFAELECPYDYHDAQHAWHLYMLRINPRLLSIDRRQFIDELRRRNIGSSVHFIPLHLHPYYRDTYGYQPESFPVAHREYEREISLPVYSKMTDADVQDVVDAVVDIVSRFRRG